MLLAVLRIVIFSQLLRILHHLFVNIAEVFEHVYKHHALLLNVSLVSVANEIHINFASSS